MRELLTSSIGLNCMHQISMPEIPVVLTELHLFQVSLRRHGCRESSESAALLNDDREELKKKDPGPDCKRVAKTDLDF